MPSIQTHPAIRQRELLHKLGISVWVKRDSEVVSAETFESRLVKVISEGVSTDSSHDAEIVAVHAVETTSNVEQVTIEGVPSENIGSAAADSATAELTALENTLEQSVAQSPRISPEVRTEQENRVEKSHPDSESVVETRLDDKPDEPTHSLPDETHHEMSDSATVTDEAQEAISFDLFALRYKNSLILCDSHAITTEKEAVLWQNIQKGLNAQLESLSFPLSEKLATDTLSAQASIAGWLYRLTNGKMADNNTQVIMLGETPAYFLEQTQVINQASLADMIAEPLHKKTLWQTLNK